MTVYNPTPTRVWNRFDTRPITSAQYALQDASQMAFKGQVLMHGQYTHALTKNQKFARVVNGNGPIRLSFATQSDVYANPNTRNLQQVGNVLLCGGSSQKICKPTTDSNIPGKIMMLCVTPALIPNGGHLIQPPRRNMGTSSNNFPTGYSNLTSAIFLPAPILHVSDIGAGAHIILSWTFPTCNIPVTSVNIYLNGELYKNVPNALDAVGGIALNYIEIVANGVYTATSINGSVVSVDGIAVKI